MVSTTASMVLWGRDIGAVSWNDQLGIAAFQFDPEFAQSGIEIAPLKMPLSNRIYTFPELPFETYRGLTGMLADSLPDRFGTAVIDAWLAQQGRDAGSTNPVEMLCYIGSRGMGALEFRPPSGPKQKKSLPLEIDALASLARDILSDRESFKTMLSDEKSTQALQEIFQVGTSAGGARAKAVIGWNPITNEVRSGQVKCDPGFTYWLLKFDGVSGTKTLVDKVTDREFGDPQGYGLIEYAYHKMAVTAGIHMTECRILAESNRHHFMTKRFDRTDDGRKIHSQSLCALAHYDYNLPGAYSYEQCLQTVRLLGLPMASLEEQFRRMLFNVVARNQDDHTKNVNFLMDRQGNWSLAPAFDVTHAFKADNKWLHEHQMSINGKRDNFDLADFDRCARVVSIKRTRVKEILNEVEEAVSAWSSIASEAGVSPKKIAEISATHRFFRRLH